MVLSNIVARLPVQRLKTKTIGKYPQTKMTQTVQKLVQVIYQVLQLQQNILHRIAIFTGNAAENEIQNPFTN